VSVCPTPLEKELKLSQCSRRMWQENECGVRQSVLHKSHHISYVRYWSKAVYYTENRIPFGTLSKRPWDEGEVWEGLPGLA
jgi:hypothetical protein